MPSVLTLNMFTVNPKPLISCWIRVGFRGCVKLDTPDLIAILDLEVYTIFPNQISKTRASEKHMSTNTTPFSKKKDTNENVVVNQNHKKTLQTTNKTFF